MNTLAPLALVNLITVLVAMLALAVFSRLYSRTWLEPGSFFLLIWVIYIFIPILVAPENHIYSFGIWYIFSFSLAIILGSLVWNRLEPVSRLDKALTRGVNLGNYSNILFNFTIIFVLLSGIGVPMLLVAGINRYNLVVELFSLSSLPNLFYVDRDSGIFQLPWQINGFIYFTYTASLIGGFTFNLFLDKKKLFCFIPLFIAFFYGVVLAVRSGIFLSIILWLSGWLGSLVYLQDFKFRPQTIMFSLVSFMVLIIVFISVGWLRSGADDYFLLMEFIDYARISYFGHLSAFSTWLNDYHYTGLTFGANTFSGPLDFLGIIEREIGFYKQNIFLTDSIYTNIFTVFRGLIEDFSIPGTLIIGFGVGMCVRLAFNRCSYGHFMWMVPLTLFYAFVLYSPIISLFNYNSAIMAWIFISIPLILIRKKLVI